jgi:hypothetical protein
MQRPKKQNKKWPRMQITNKKIRTKIEIVVNEMITLKF